MVMSKERAPRKGNAAGMAAPQLITPALLRKQFGLSHPDGGDKETRGCVLLIGGSREMPGGVILAATAALHAGAGKLQIATCRSVAAHVGAAVPEARVFALAETRHGGIAPSAAKELAEHARAARAVVIGPGMVDGEAAARLLVALVPRLEGACFIVDAAPLEALSKDKAALHALGKRAVITPHAGEMAQLTGLQKAAIVAEPLAVARGVAAEVRAVVALKGEETFIALPDGTAYLNRKGNIGLATSGSGDVLAGIIGGIAARGAEAAGAAAWGVHLHACAGDRLAARMGRIGFLARQLSAEVPALLTRWGGAGE